MKKATQEQAKWHNRRLILKMIYNHGAISRAQLARITCLTRTTVSGLVEELVQAGLVKEVGYGPSVGGKPPTLLMVRSNARLLLCLDLSEDRFRGALMDLRGRVIERVTLEKHDQGEKALAQVIALVRTLVDMASEPLLGIGIGSQGMVDRHSGIIYRAVRLNWKNLPLKKILEETFSLPVSLVNDSDAAVLAEYAFKSCKEQKNMVLLRVGSGVSAGLLLNGRLHNGDSFGAGEIGHICVVPDGETCDCGKRGCLEMFSSSRALLRNAKEIYRQHPDSFLCRLVDQPVDLTLEIVLDAFRQNDPYVKEALRVVALYLGRVMAYIVSLLNVRSIRITGRMTCFGEALLELIRSEMKTHCLDALAQETEICFSPYDDDLVLLGGAALLLRENLGLV